MNADQFTPELVVLTTTFVILVGAALMPALVVVARFAFRFSVDEAISTVRNEFIQWAAIAANALVFGLIATPAPAAATEKPVAVRVAEAASTPAAALDTAIIQTFARVVTAGAKPLPVWLLDAAARIYTAYRIHQVGKKADEAARIALAAMTELPHVRADIDVGPCSPKRSSGLCARTSRRRRRRSKVLRSASRSSSSGPSGWSRTRATR